MTYRDIFLQADPRAVNDAVGAQEVEFRGRKVRFTTHQAFDICKGLKYYAKGERLDESDEEAIEKIVKANPRLTPKLVQVLMTGLRGYLSAVCEALGFNRLPNPDELVNEWLDQTEPNGIEDANKLATDIISRIIMENLRKYE